jgi:hypothetical protein
MSRTSRLCSTRITTRVAGLADLPTLLSPRPAASCAFVARGTPPSWQSTARVVWTGSRHAAAWAFRARGGEWTVAVGDQFRTSSLAAIIEASRRGRVGVRRDVATRALQHAVRQLLPLPDERPQLEQHQLHRLEARRRRTRYGSMRRRGSPASARTRANPALHMTTSQPRSRASARNGSCSSRGRPACNRRRSASRCHAQRHVERARQRQHDLAARLGRPVATKLRCRGETSASAASASWLIVRAARYSRSNAPQGSHDGTCQRHIGAPRAVHLRRREVRRRLRDLP